MVDAKETLPSRHNRTDHIRTHGTSPAHRGWCTREVSQHKTDSIVAFSLGGHHCILLGVVFVCLVEVFFCLSILTFDFGFWNFFSGRRRVGREEGKILEKLGEEKECDHQNIQ